MSLCLQCLPVCYKVHNSSGRKKVACIIAYKHSTVCLCVLGIASSITWLMPGSAWGTRIGSSEKKLILPYIPRLLMLWNTHLSHFFFFGLSLLIRLLLYMILIYTEFLLCNLHLRIVISMPSRLMGPY